MSPSKADHDTERMARVDLMMKELAAVEIPASELAEEIRERTRTLAKILEELKDPIVSAVSVREERP